MIESRYRNRLVAHTALFHMLALTQFLFQRTPPEPERRAITAVADLTRRLKPVVLSFALNHVKREAVPK